MPIGPSVLASVRELRELIAQPRWKRLLAYVASTRSEPLYFIQTISAGVAEGPSDPQIQFHSDTFHPSLKAWLFLTEVPEDGRPLTYVPGSHRLTPERLAWEHERSCNIEHSDRLSQRGSFRITREELPSLGLPSPIHFAVPANTLVVADTYGFHARGDSDHPTLRVELWAYCRRSPFLPWTGLDLLSLPPFAKRRAQWAAAIMDWLDRRGLAKQHWRKAGKRRPIDP